MQRIALGGQLEPPCRRRLPDPSRARNTLRAARQPCDTLGRQALRSSAHVHAILETHEVDKLTMSRDGRRAA
jgi:hypothetical protein